MQLNHLKDLYTEQLRDLYDAEKQLLSALPGWSEKAQDEELASNFESQREHTTKQIERLENCFRELDIEPTTETCHGMKGLIQEGSEFLAADGDPNVIDAGLVAATQRVNHYEIAGFGTARSFAGRLGLESSTKLLQECLDEQATWDKRLTKLAETSGGLNQKAQAQAV